VLSPFFFPLGIDIFKATYLIKLLSRLQTECEEIKLDSLERNIIYWIIKRSPKDHEELLKIMDVDGRSEKFGRYWLYSVIDINNYDNKLSRMTQSLFLLQSHKFSNDNIEATLVCLKCDDVFKKVFPLDLEGQTIEFKCPVCNSSGEADLPYKKIEEREELEEDFAEIEQDNSEEFEDIY
jgi:hypothetical protein